MYFIRFKVSGHYAFPLDMLRFDACYPYNGEAVGMIERASASDPNRVPGVRTVELAHWSDRKHWEPTAARWSSFGWSVVEVAEAR
jgi:hypothetical protein